MSLRRPLLLAVLVSAMSACSLVEERPLYSGPADYAFTLTVGCFCPYVGPVRVTVRDNEVVEVRQLEPRAEGGTVDAWIREQAQTLTALSELARRARRDADEVDVEYDPVYGFPTDLYIDWYSDAVDDEIGYTVRDFEVQ